MPARVGARATLTAAAPTATLGLIVVALAPATAPALAGVVILGVGQALAVPALGLLALARVPAAEHGAASGVFFAWFDAGVRGAQRAADDVPRDDPDDRSEGRVAADSAAEHGQVGGAALPLHT